MVEVFIVYLMIALIIAFPYLLEGGEDISGALQIAIAWPLFLLAVVFRGFKKGWKAVRDVFND